MSRKMYGWVTQFREFEWVAVSRRRPDMDGRGKCQSSPVSAITLGSSTFKIPKL